MRRAALRRRADELERQDLERGREHGEQVRGARGEVPPAQHQLAEARRAEHGRDPRSEECLLLQQARDPVVDLQCTQVRQAAKTRRVPLRRREAIFELQPEAHCAYVLAEVGRVEVEEVEAVVGVCGRYAEGVEDVGSAECIPCARYQRSVSERVVLVGVTVGVC